MPIRTICISRTTGAGGESVGRDVAQRLGYQYLDDEIITMASEWADLDPALVGDVERRRPLVRRLLGELAVQPTALRLPTDEPGQRLLPAEADLRALITDAIRTAADEGDVVIVSHAASFALAGREILRVHVTASPGTRANRLRLENNVNEKAAAQAIRSHDEARAGYLKRFYGVDHELDVHYDVVVNTDVLTPAQAVEVVIAAAG